MNSRFSNWPFGAIAVTLFPFFSEIRFCYRSGRPRSMPGFSDGLLESNLFANHPHIGLERASRGLSNWSQHEIYKLYDTNLYHNGGRGHQIVPFLLEDSFGMPHCASKTDLFQFGTELEDCDVEHAGFGYPARFGFPNGQEGSEHGQYLRIEAQHLFRDTSNNR